MKKKSTVSSGMVSIKEKENGVVFDGLRFLSFLLLPIGLICSMVLAPEGAFREGDFLPSCLIMFLSLFFLCGSVLIWNKHHPDRGFRFHRADLIVLLLFVWCAISYLVVLEKESGNLRFASNMFWIQTLMYSLYFCFRLLSPACFRKSISSFLIVIFAIVIAESLFSVYAYTVRDPAFRKAWITDAEALMEKTGMNYPPGSLERIMLENRILGSTEPLGTFGLTNTLAGLLVPWAVFSVSLFFRFLSKGIEIGLTRRKDGLWKWILGSSLFWGGLSALFFTCLLLTKSRTGILAFLFGLGIVFFGFILCRGWMLVNRKRFFLLTGSFAVLFLVGIFLAFLFGGIDREVFTEAGKSLGYRLEYWTASLKMIADRPILGIGPGNFQTMYPFYMLPQSSEIIADPHNFAFEMATNFGLPALILFILFLVQILLLFLGKGSFQDLVPEEKIPSAPVLIGGFLGGIIILLLSYIISAPVDYFFILLFWISLAACWGLFVFLRKSVHISVLNEKTAQNFTLLLLLGGFGSILLNLCAAGGIFYPAVIFPFWIFAALMVNRDTEKAEVVKKRSYPILFVMGGAFLLFMICLLHAQKPMLLGKIRIMELEENLIIKKFNPESLLDDHYWNVDPWSIPLARMRYELLFDASNRFAGNMFQDHWEKSRKHLLKITPHSSSVRLMMGERELALAMENKDKNLLAIALEDLKESVEYAPQNSRARMLYAKALWEAEEKERAVQEIRRSLELDDQMDHKDRKLPEDLRKFGESRK